MCRNILNKRANVRSGQTNKGILLKIKQYKRENDRN